MSDDSIKKILTPLNLPQSDVELRCDADSRRGGLELYDPLRQRWVALTPEEWVRRHFTAFMESERGVPPALMANEVSLEFNGMSRRCDTVIYSRSLKPLCIIEYKAPDVVLTQKVFDQIARYNSVLHAPYLIVSNGMEHYCCRYRGSTYKFLREIPRFEEFAGE